MEPAGGLNADQFNLISSGAITELISVTVYAKDALTADGYDNGFMAMGLSRTLSFLAGRKDMGAYMVYRDKHGIIRDTVTSSFMGYTR